MQRLKRAAKVMGTKSDLEIIGLISKEMGRNIGIWTPDKVFEEIPIRPFEDIMSPCLYSRAAERLSRHQSMGV